MVLANPRVSSSPANKQLVKCLVLMLAGASGACSSESINDTGLRVSVCHRELFGAELTDVRLTDLSDHKSHGDYVAQLVVDRLSTGGDSIHFRRVTDALAVARSGRLERNEITSAACRITISVAPGTLRGSTAASADPLFELFPLVIDVPDITIQGALRMGINSSGRATGIGSTADVTTFAPSPGLRLLGTSSRTAVAERIIIVNGHPDGSKGNGAVIEGFAFQSGQANPDSTGGQGILTMRVADVIIRGNRFEGGFNSSIDLQASRARVEQNHLSGIGSSCDICLAGPGDYVVRENTVIGGGIPGVLILPAVSIPVPAMVEPFILPATSLVTAVVSNNEVRGHSRRPVGVGLRVGAIGVDAWTVAGTSKISFTGNSLIGNTFGIIIEGAFINPADLTRRKGDIEVATSGNVITGSCQNNLLVALSNSQTGLGIANNPSLANSVFSLTLGADLPWANAWYANAPGNGNTLMVNGAAIPNGFVHSYNAARVC